MGFQYGDKEMRFFEAMYIFAYPCIGMRSCAPQYKTIIGLSSSGVRRKNYKVCRIYRFTREEYAFVSI